MEINTKTLPIYSEKSIFTLVERLFIATQKKNLEEYLQCFSENIEFRVSDHSTELLIIGIGDLRVSMEEMLKEIKTFSFEIKKVLWDSVLKEASAIIKYEAIIGGVSQCIYEISFFVIENEKIS